MLRDAMPFLETEVMFDGPEKAGKDGINFYNHVGETKTPHDLWKQDK
ncbi:unnamed protein product, partial [Amoebophrya sp. A120]|eukprot:GSA120T00006239001.1